MEGDLEILLYTPEIDDRPVFLVGNFNKWKPALSEYCMQRTAPGEYRYRFADTGKLPELLEFKFTKGDWSEVEIDRFGSRTPNRKVPRSRRKSTQLVERWRENWLPYSDDKLPRIELISDSFYIPQMNKHRRIWALLPNDYDKSKSRYPVIYLHDAQNLFNEAAPYGNWEIDKKLAVLSEYGWGDIVVIAIEHGDQDRLVEYTINNPFYGPGDGKKYLRFVTDTLKPYVDEHFRTLPEREYTGMGGSSLGGLISLYAGMLYPEVYSKLMVFSPSLWLVPDMTFALPPFTNPFHTKIYLYGGERESETMVSQIMDFKESVETQGSDDGKIDFRVCINPEGHHSERYWSIEFPKAIEWLFFDEGKVDVSFHKEDLEKLIKK